MVFSVHCSKQKMRRKPVVESAETVSRLPREVEAGGRSWVAGSPPGFKQTNNIVDSCFHVLSMPIPSLSTTSFFWAMDRDIPSFQVVQGARLESIEWTKVFEGLKHSWPNCQTWPTYFHKLDGIFHLFDVAVAFGILTKMLDGATSLLPLSSCTLYENLATTKAKWLPFRLTLSPLLTVFSFSLKKKSKMMYFGQKLNFHQNFLFLGHFVSGSLWGDFPFFDSPPYHMTESTQWVLPSTYVLAL